MNPSRPFIYRPVATSLIMLGLIIFGIATYKYLPVACLPTMSYPTIMVSTNYPGASPEEMANLVSSPLERQFMLMQGIQFVTSQNTYQSSQVILQFHPDVDINVAAINTQEAITEASAQLPANLPQSPTYTKVNPADTPILFIAIYSDLQDQATLYEYAYNYIGQQVGTVEGVANIQVYGQPYAVKVQIDPQAIAAKGMTLQEVANAIQSNNPIQPVGKFYGNNWSIVNTADGQLQKADEYNSMILKINEDNIVRLQDVGFASDSTQDDKQQFGWLVHNDPKIKEVVFLAIYRQPGYNTVDICTNIENLLDRLEKNLPRSITLAIPYSQKTIILEAIEDVELTLILAFLLVVVVVFFYLGKLRNSLIPLITLPITVLGTFVIMYLLGFTIDVMSMSALTLAIGFLVDDAIIVLENIVRYIEEGESPFKGALRGSKQIIITVLSISLCLSAVFVPMIFLPGVMGQLFYEFAAVILIAVLFSGFVSLSLTPMLCSRFIPKYDPKDRSSLELFSIKFNEWLKRGYKPLLEWSLRHKLFMSGLAIGSFLGSLHFLYVMPKEFLPPMDIGVIMSFLIAREGTSPEKMEDYLVEYGKIIQQNEYVRYVSLAGGYPTDSEAMLFVILTDPEKRPATEIVLQQIQQLTQNIVGCDLIMKPFPLINLQVGSIDSGRANYQYILQGMDQEIVNQKAIDMLAALQKVPSLSQVNSNFQPYSPTYNIHLLRDEARAYGNITPTDIENAFMYAYGETYISKINSPENMYYVILEVFDPFQYTTQNTDTLFLGQYTGNTAIDSVTTAKMGASPIMINHVNTLPSVSFSFNVTDGYALSQALADLQKAADEVLEGKVIGFLAGNTAAFETAMIQFMVLIVLALFVIYLTLGILYENFIHPITPLSAVPLAIFGGLLTLVLFNEALSVFAFIGIIMLMGIVMKNGILIVDFALEELEKNKHCTAEEAILEASMVRFRPILMTTLAAMMGAVPVALGIGGTIAAGRAPLGIAVVGGLIFAQIVSLFIVPVIFCYAYRISHYLTTRTQFFKEHLIEEE